MTKDLLQEDNLLASEIGRLSEENRNIKNENQNLSYKINKLENIFWINKWGSIILFCLLLCPIVAIITYSCYKMIITPNIPEYCFITKANNMITYYSVVGEVPWGTNINYGNYNTMDEAINAIKVNNCKFQP